MLLALLGSAGLADGAEPSGSGFSFEGTTSRYACAFAAGRGSCTPGSANPVHPLAWEGRLARIAGELTWEDAGPVPLRAAIEVVVREGEGWTHSRYVALGDRPFSFDWTIGEDLPGEAGIGVTVETGASGPGGAWAAAADARDYAVTGKMWTRST